MVKRYFKRLVPIFGVLWVVTYFGNDVLRRFEGDAASVSTGTVSGGNLSNGKRLPSAGTNFHVNSRLSALVMGNYVHEKVRDLILDAYDSLSVILPNKKFIYGQAGGNGIFSPRSNGMSIDFMVPVIDLQGNSTTLPIYPWNQFGYGVKFNVIGKRSPYRIDFQAMAAHIFILNKLAAQHGMSVARVFFDPGLQPILFRTAFGAKLQQEINFPGKPGNSALPYDNHYRVDFSFSTESVNETVTGTDQNNTAKNYR
ncbi:MAG: replication initiation protein [Calditrichaeota bacterium]|nr:replication initiation protein [Calditrichota bacterium]HQU71033.1 replication initiation protein [Calditrichia bacterium]